MRLRVEADEIGAEQAVQQILLPRTDAECFRIRPRDVPEHGDLRIGPLGLQQRGQQGEVIVLNENDGTAGAAQLVECRARELPVGDLVMRPV
jgi:hypothetical protein